MSKTRTRLRTAAWATTVVLLAMLAPGCAGDPTPSGENKGTPQRGGTITVVGAYEPNSFNVKVPAKQTEANGT